MSFPSKSPRVLGQQLKVQELVVSDKDLNLIAVSGSDLIIFIDEPVEKVMCALVIDDSAGTIVPVQAANISIVDSTAYTAGGDKQAIKLASVALASNDRVIIKHIVQD